MCVGDGCSSCRASRGYACLVVMVVIRRSVDGYSVNHVYKGLINKGILEKKEKKTLRVWAKLGPFCHRRAPSPSVDVAELL
jgi:hypothetical protein